MASRAGATMSVSVSGARPPGWKKRSEQKKVPTVFRDRENDGRFRLDSVVMPV